MNELQSDVRSGEDWQDSIPILDQTMSALSDHDRDAVMLRFFDELSFAEIGNRLRLTESGARMKVERAIEKLRVLLLNRGVTSTTAALSAIIASQAGLAAPTGLAAAVTGTALASKAIAGSSAFSLLQLLGNAKAIIGASAAVWLGAAAGIPAIGAVFYEFREARHSHKAMMVAAGEQEVQVARLRALQLSLGGADRNRSKLLARVDALRTSTAAAREPTPAAEGQKLLVRFPQSRAMLMAAAIPKVAEDYQAFFRLANLTPSQIDQFENLMAATWTNSVRVTPTDISAGIRTPSEDQLRTVLGDHGYRQFQYYNQMQYAYQFTGLLAAAVNLADEPLSVGQIDQLAQIVAGNSSLYREGHDMNQGTATFSDASNSVNWDNVTAQTKAILSQAQWTTIQSPILNAKLDVAVTQARKGQSTAQTIP